MGVDSEPLTAVAQLEDQRDQDRQGCCTERNPQRQLAIPFFLRGCGHRGTLGSRVYLCLVQAWCQALASSRLLVMLRPHKKFTKRLRKWLGLSKYQFLWLTFGKGVVIGYLLALLIHR